MQKSLNDFVSREQRNFPFKIGKQLASSLSGFLTGLIVMGIIWYMVAWATSQAVVSH